MPSKTKAIKTLWRQLDSLHAWIKRQLPEEIAKPPLKDHVETLVQIRMQDLEPDPHGGGARIREGVADERRMSIGHKGMRHGRQSKSKRFNGFQRHCRGRRSRPNPHLRHHAGESFRGRSPAVLDSRPRAPGLDVDQLLIDRAYINSPLVDTVLRRRGTIVCKPWKSRNGSLFPKSAFTLDIRNRAIECPNGHVQDFSFGTVVEFDPDRCDRRPLHARCTTSEFGDGRSVVL